MYIIPYKPGQLPQGTLEPVERITAEERLQGCIARLGKGLALHVGAEEKLRFRAGGYGFAQLLAVHKELGYRDLLAVIGLSGYIEECFSVFAVGMHLRQT